MHSLSCDNNSTAITGSLIKYELQTKMYAQTTKQYTNVKNVQWNLNALVS